MDNLADLKYDISQSLKHLKIHKRMYLGGVNGGLLQDHILSLKYGLKFIQTFLDVSQNEDLIERILSLVSNMKQKLYSLRIRYLDNDESLVVKLEHAYADMREEMKNVIINPRTNEYDVIIPRIFDQKMFTLVFVLNEIGIFLSEKINKLVTSDCKADQITFMMKELEAIWKMLRSLLASFFINVEDKGSLLHAKEKVNKVFATITDVLDRATCLIYLSFVRKMDDEMVISLKNSLSDLIIEETQIMNMYLSLDIDSSLSLQSDIAISLRLLWNRKFYSGIVMEAALEDHRMSIEHGLQFLVKILEISGDIYLNQRIQRVASIVKHKLYLLSHNEEDKYLAENLEYAFGEMREEMETVVINPGTDDYYPLFPESHESKLNWYFLGTMKDFLLEKIQKLVTSSFKADKIAPVLKELEELRKKLTSFEPLFDYVSNGTYAPMEEAIFDSLTTFLDRATNLIYLSFIGKWDEYMLVSVRKTIFLLTEETEIKGMSPVLGIVCEDLKFDIDISLSLLERQEEYHKATMNGSMLKDHIMSLKHGIEFLEWFPIMIIDRDFKRHIMLLAANVKQKLESLTCEQGAESLSIDVSGAYADLREVMKNVIMDVNGAINKYSTLFPKQGYLNSNNDFLLEKITTLVTSNCKADQIAPLKKELQDLRKMLTSLKPLCFFVEGGMPWLRNEEKILTTLLTVHQMATVVIYVSFVAKMDVEMVFLVKSDISTTIKETDIWDIYTMNLNKVYLNSDYLQEELYLLENLTLMLKSNVESFNDASSKLYEALIDIHRFLLGLYPNVLLRKLHLLQASFEAILGHSIPIVCSCYLEHTEADISNELDCVLNLIKHIKYEVQEIKLYYFPRVDDLGFLEYFSGYLEALMKNCEISMRGEIEALHFEFHSLLSLAEVTNEGELNKTTWTDIINLAYQAEYIIDLYLVSSSSEDLGLISSLFKIIGMLVGFKAELHMIELLDKNICLSEKVAATSKPQVLGTTTQVSDNGAAIVGLQEEVKIIMEYLLKGEDKLDVISVVGMAGVGKTTLALTLYKIPSVADHFDILSWCLVSQTYRNRDVLLVVLDQVNALNKNHRKILDDQELADHLCRSLKKRRYLIVLDDIWDTKLLNYLKSCLPDDRNGSRILITTRNRDVAVQIGSKMNELHGLSEGTSWELFQKKMLGKESLSGNLLKISKGIVEHCKGLPLSIILIAGILSDIERTEKKWNQIAESVSSLILSESQGKCKAILELSYNQLPNQLRSCFLYMGSFPEDQEIYVTHLIVLWIAEGLVRDTKSESAEEVANKYVDYLIVKSLVIPTRERSRGGVKCFRLHDLLRDFCLDKSKENHFFTLLDKRNYSQALQDPRRLFINLLRINGIHFSCHSIRSMICFHEMEASAIEKGIESYDMVLIKVLEVRQLLSRHFPNISSLVHLRYLALGLQNHEISVLPSSISKLQNLQILILRCRCHVMRVPDSIYDMIRLRLVDISPEALFQVDSKRLEKSFLLENLKSLSKVRVSCGDSKWLSKLSRLQRVSYVFVDDDLKDNQFQMVSFIGHLTSLKAENATAGKQRFIGTCQLPISLRELTLSKFDLTSNDISHIGRSLPHLEVFKIYRCSVPSAHEWNVDDEDFPRLNVLKLRSLEISKWIASENSFPMLEQLWMKKCYYLDQIPLDFGYLPKLKLISVRDCHLPVNNSAREIEKMQHEDQNTEMRAHIVSTT